MKKWKIKQRRVGLGKIIVWCVWVPGQLQSRVFTNSDEAFAFFREETML